MERMVHNTTACLPEGLTIRKVFILMFILSLAFRMILIIPSSENTDMTIDEWQSIHTYNKNNQAKNELINNINSTQQTHNRHAQGEQCIKRLPQAIIVGVQKCGTTALIRFLSQHPEIAALHNEDGFFTTHYSKGMDWYKKLMPCSFSNQITMEKSPGYFRSDVTPQLIHKMNPKTKIIIVVKDPITRMISEYAMKRAHEVIPDVKFEQLVTVNNGLDLDMKSKLFNFSDYETRMKPWLANFPRDLIHVVDGQTLEINPHTELTSVEQFLNIRHFFAKDKFVFNKTKGKFCFMKTFGEIECLSDTKGRAHPRVRKHTIKLLRKCFKPKNKRFFKLIGKRFEWGY